MKFLLSIRRAVIFFLFSCTDREHMVWQTFVHGSFYAVPGGAVYGPCCDPGEHGEGVCVRSSRTATPGIPASGGAYTLMGIYSYHGISVKYSVY